MDEGVQSCYARGNESALPESALVGGSAWEPWRIGGLIGICHSFYNDLDRLFAPDFKPTEQDIIRVRVKTSGISETKFLVGDLTYL